MRRTDETNRFGVWLQTLLSIDGDRATNRLEAVLDEVPKSSLSIEQLKSAFLSYTNGKFTLEPKDNYLTVILYNKVVNCYIQENNKKHQFKEASSAIQPLTDKDYKRIIGEEFLSFKATKSINYMRFYLFEYLAGKDLLPTDAMTLEAIKKIAVENLVGENSKKIKTPVNKSEHLMNVINVSEKTLFTEIKKITLERFFNQFKTPEQLLNKLL